MFQRFHCHFRQDGKEKEIGRFFLPYSLKEERRLVYVKLVLYFFLMIYETFFLSAMITSKKGNDKLSEHKKIKQLTDHVSSNSLIMMSCGKPSLPIHLCRLGQSVTKFLTVTFGKPR